MCIDIAPARSQSGLFLNGFMDLSFHWSDLFALSITSYDIVHFIYLQSQGFAQFYKQFAATKSWILVWLIHDW